MEPTESSRLDPVNGMEISTWRISFCRSKPKRYAYHQNKYEAYLEIYVPARAGILHHELTVKLSLPYQTVAT